MSGIAELRFEIPDNLKPVAALAIGSLIMVCLVVMRGVGLYYALRANPTSEQCLLVGPTRVLGVSSPTLSWSATIRLELRTSDYLR